MFAVLSPGCGPTTTRPGFADGAASEDLTLVQSHDHDLGSTDLASYAGKSYHYVVDRMMLPQARGDFGYASNGDGSPHNQFALLAVALASKSLPLHPAELSGITIDGDPLTLLSLGTVDPALITDDKAFTSIYLGKPQKVPNLTGTGSFEVNSMELSGRLAGALIGGSFAGTDPTRLPSAPTAPLRLALLGSQPVTLPLVGAHIVYAVSKTGLMSGQIHGALRPGDIDKVLIPALVANLNQLAHKANCDIDCKNALLNFDILTPDKTITAAEVKASFLATILIPDEQLFDLKGNWAPSPANRLADSFSVGVGFTAQLATFTE